MGSASACSGRTAPVRPPRFTYSRRRPRPPARTLALRTPRAGREEPRRLSPDEPAARLDPRARRSLWEQLRALRAASGLTVLLTTHYVEEAEPCDRVAVLDRGRLAALGTPPELKQAVGATSLEEAFLAHTGHHLAETDGG